MKPTLNLLFRSFKSMAESRGGRLFYWEIV
jgi:hypothetical protein